MAAMQGMGILLGIPGAHWSNRTAQPGKNGRPSAWGYRAVERADHAQTVW